MMKIRKVNTKYDSKASYMHVYKARYVEKYILLKKPKILDIGSWTGQFHQALSVDHDYYAVDVDRQVVEYLNSKEFVKGAVLGAASDIPFKSNFFDLAIFSEVIEHIPKGSEAKALKEIHRVLRREGLLFLSTPHDSSVSKFLDPAYWLKNHRHYKKSDLTQMVESCGFSVLEINVIGNYWHSISHILQLISKHIFDTKVSSFISKYFEARSEKCLYSDKTGYLTVLIVAKKT